ncbi:MAG TPA: hypothetical protein VNB29_08950 [Chthoniobacterales bacterium]|jgi:hypothetical protein|nr:hypothetical protein [Chthoniobacterales bacterium]
MDIHPLTPIENDIIVEICRYLATRAASAEEVGDVIGVLGCWGDTLPEEDILSLLRAINSHVHSDLSLKPSARDLKSRTDKR